MYIVFVFSYPYCDCLPFQHKMHDALIFFCVFSCKLIWYTKYVFSDARIFRDKRGEAGVSTRSVARASTLPTRKSNFDKTDKAKEKQRQKEKEKREKEMKVGYSL